MAYLHCHNCGWSQDDFWHEGWNPVKSVGLWEDKFLEDDFREKVKNEEYTWQEFIARHFEQNAKKIRNMEYRTMDEYRKLNPERKCPKCGQQQLDID